MFTLPAFESILVNRRLKIDAGMRRTPEPHVQKPVDGGREIASFTARRATPGSSSL
jgi:hypothetical protein